LIRYRLGDRTAMVAGDCPCGRYMPRIHGVDTKAEDQILRPDGTVISASVLTHPFKPLSCIEKSQIIQRTESLIEIMIVRRPDYRLHHEQQLLREFRKRVGAFEVNVVYVEEIPSDANGKFRWVINETTGSRQIASV
jgi:phenylacetate-CoA ligase